MVSDKTPGRNEIFSSTVRDRARSISRRLARRGLSISVCESCTGGMLGTLLTEVSGSSRYFLGGIIAYADRIKEEVVGLSRTALRRHGAVSAETSWEMARGVRKIFRADIGVAITGIAGPRGGSRTKPVGLVYVTAAGPDRTETARCRFKGNRQEIRMKACWVALELTGILISPDGWRKKRG
jgi:PncC family amidohydrolase